MKCQQYSGIGTSYQSATALHHEVHEGDPNLLPGHNDQCLSFLHALHVCHG